MKGCIACNSDNSKNTIYSDDLVKVVLRVDNQCWLGRCIIVPHEHISPFVYYSERMDLVKRVSSVIALLWKVFKDQYGMSMGNISQLGNLTHDEQGNKTSEEKYHHVHFHFIPRYERQVQMYGYTFRDEQWGKPLNIDTENGLAVFVPPSELVDAIVNHIGPILQSEAYSFIGN